MPKTDTIAAITKLNPTATPVFLEEFPASELTRYLDRLRRVAGPDSIPSSAERFALEEWPGASAENEKRDQFETPSLFANDDDDQAGQEFE